MSVLAPVVYGKYQLLELLARGGMAEVYKAKSHGVEGFEKVLVIKRILTELSENPRFVEMFINEAKIAVTLSHANVVQVFDLGKAEETYFIAMEYVAGQDLATVLRRGRHLGRNLSVPLAVFVISEVAKGLDYAHRRRDADLQPLNIVHRDISPQNVLLSFEGEVKLTDFGIAKARTTVESQSESGILKGKYAYMAPEQARGEAVDARSDIYSLGVVLYEALAGVNPFHDSSPYETLRRVRDAEFLPLSARMPELPEELCSIVARAMAPSPGDRFANAGLFYEELVAFLYGTGRRVGAHDLSGYLEALSTLAKKGVREGSTSAKLRASFEVETQSRGQEELTGAEVPSARGRDGKSDGDGKQPPEPRTAKPKAERRDLSVLAIHCPRGVEIEGLVGGILRKAGATVVATPKGLDAGFTRYAVFGLHEPDGRDTEAAARAALALRRQVDTKASGISLAVGTGHGLVEDEQLQDEATFRELLTRARGAAQGASVSRPVATPAAARVLRRHFELEEREGQLVILGERNLSEAVGPFVGRKDELRRVGEVLAVAAKGRLCTLQLIGEAGIGKSRLLMETMRRLLRGGHDVATYVCRVPAQSRDVPLATCQEMLRTILGIEEFDREPAIREKISRLRELGLSTPELDAVTMTLGLPVEADLGNTEGVRPLRQAIRRIALKLAEDRLTLFAFDDFDGVDSESLELLKELIGRRSNAKIVLALMHRPGFGETLEPAYGYTVRLGSLEDEDVARLTGARLGVAEVPMNLLREVSGKSVGNPLYVEEYLLALEEAGALRLRDDEVRFEEGAAVEVPKTLRGIVASRLGRLPAEQRVLMQAASVIGGRFHSKMVRRVVAQEPEVADQHLEALVEKGLLSRTGPGEYGFFHALIGGVLYGQLPIAARRELHRAVAEALVAVYPKHHDELAERLAHHYEEAGERREAVQWWLRSTDRLEVEGALAGAIANLRRSLEMLRRFPSPDHHQVLSLYRRAIAMSYSAQQLALGVELCDEAAALAEDLGNNAERAFVAMLRARLLVARSNFGEAELYFEQARTIAESLEDVELLSQISLAEAEGLASNGQNQEAARRLEQALAISRERQDVATQLRCLEPLALAYGASRNPEGAYAAIDEAYALREHWVHHGRECQLRKTESLVAYFNTDLPRAVQAAEAGLELAKELNLSHEVAVNAHNLGEFLLYAGDFRRAFATIRYSYDVSREHDYQRLVHANLRVLGYIDAVKLGSEEGRRKVHDAFNFAQANAMVWDLVQCRYFLALIDHEAGNVADAVTGLREVARISAEHGQRHYLNVAEQALAAIEAGEAVSLSLG